MDINQSSFARYKSNKYAASSHPNTKSMSDATILRSSGSISSNQALPKLDLKEGQMIKGEIIDRILNEIRLQVKPTDQVITAKLSADIPLSIGQEAEFQVTESSPDQLTLKYIPGTDNATSNPTIEKALSASGLPFTERNKALVDALLKHNMPIDRQTIQNLVRLSHQNREASPLTLVLLLKNNIPLTASNISQLESYQNGTNQLLRDLFTVTKDLSELIQASEDLDTIKAWNNKLLELISSTPSSKTYLSPASSLSSPLLSMVKPEDLALIIDDLEQRIHNAELTSQQRDALLSQLRNGTITPEDVFRLMNRQYAAEADHNTSAYEASSINNELLQIAYELDDNLQNNDINSGHFQPITQSNDLLRHMLQQINTTDVKDAFITPALANILKQFIQMPSGDIAIGHILSPEERFFLLDQLKPLLFSEEFSNKIADGIISLEEILNNINQRLTGLDDRAVKSLLQSDQYRKLLEEALHQKWTLTPEEIAKKFTVKDYYVELEQDIEQLHHLLNQTGMAKDHEFGLPVKNIQDHLNFLKDLNQMFTYLQLPVQLKNRDLHSELYVFTRKNALKRGQSNLSVLLHLDMEYLGPLNVHIQLTNNKIYANFYLEQKETGQLIKEHLHTLISVLKKKGYDLQADVKDSYKKLDFSRDFLEKNSQDHLIKRYSFDIRT
jgi:hypothetical protein